VKRELGKTAFERENAKNQAEYVQAQIQAETARERRQQKREKKRQRLHQQKRRSVVPDDDSSDDEPLATRRRIPDGEESLFIGSTEPIIVSNPATGSRARQPPNVRQGPLLQSSSEEESDSGVAGSTSVRQLQRKRKLPQNVDQSTAENLMGTSILQSKRSKETRASPVKAGESTTPGVKDADQEIRSSRGKHDAQDEDARKLETGVTTSHGQGDKVTVHKSTGPAAPLAIAEEGSTVASAIAPKSTATRPLNSSKMRAFRSVPQKQATRAINFVNEPKEQQKEWSSDKHFSTLKYRYNAAKRSQVEGAPDFNALDFVHGPPPSLPKVSATAASSDPYGRREIINRRVQQDDPEDRTLRHTIHDPLALADWEADKVPLMCASWRLSNDCRYGAQKCRFMHRDRDAKGNEYPVGNIEGWVPFKFRKPPITCLYWYDGKCTKTAEQCMYAHKNTGWTETNGQVKPISESTSGPICQQNPALVPFKFQDPPITCSYWLRDPNGCIKTDEVCKYAHWNTGWALPENDRKGQHIQIDPNQAPRWMPPKYANPPVTCPFWLRKEKGCIRTDDECKFAHRNTGWAPPSFGNGSPEQIDPQEPPLFQKHSSKPDNTAIALSRTSSDSRYVDSTSHAAPRGPRLQSGKTITCSDWLRHPDGCIKPEKQCEFAHKNTGWAISKHKPSNPPVPLDPNQIPRSHRERMGEKIEPKYANPPVTCPSWLKGDGVCPRTAENCKYAHKNTGWVPRYGLNGGPAMEIARNERPHNQEPTHDKKSRKSALRDAFPPVTCHFWLRGFRGCEKPDEICSFAHRNTGWYLPFGEAEPIQIDPNEQPKHSKHRELG
jgi:hypothetical protein